jgi:hypothetical protein
MPACVAKASSNKPCFPGECSVLKSCSRDALNGWRSGIDASIVAQI